MVIALEVLVVPSVAIHRLQENLVQLWHVSGWNKYNNQRFSCVSAEKIKRKVCAAFLDWLGQNWILFIPKFNCAKNTNSLLTQDFGFAFIKSSFNSLPPWSPQIWCIVSYIGTSSNHKRDSSILHGKSSRWLRSRQNDHISAVTHKEQSYVSVPTCYILEPTAGGSAPAWAQPADALQEKVHFAHIVKQFRLMCRKDSSIHRGRTNYETQGLKIKLNL